MRVIFFVMIFCFFPILEGDATSKNKRKTKLEQIIDKIKQGQTKDLTKKDTNYANEIGTTPLLKLAQDADLENLKKAVELGADPKATDINGFTAYHYALSHTPLEVITSITHFNTYFYYIQYKMLQVWEKEGKISVSKILQDISEVVKYISSLGVDINQKNDDKQTPFQWVARATDDAPSEMVSLLEEKKPFEYTKLDKKLLKLFVDLGADIEVRDQRENKTTPLLFHAKAGNLQAVQTLLELGADLFAKGSHSFTALHMASEKSNDPKLVEFLLEKGLDANAKASSGSLGLTPLHLAARSGNMQIVQALLEKGADKNAHSKHYGIPLHSATHWSASHEIIPLLSEDQNINRLSQEKTPLLQATMGIQFNPKVIKALLEKGADPTISDNWGTTPLHKTADTVDDSKTIQLLIDKGADVNAKDHLGRTPLHLAAERNHIDTVRVLVKNGADKNAHIQTTKRTPLHVAVYKEFNQSLQNYFTEKEEEESFDYDSAREYWDNLSDRKKKAIEKRWEKEKEFWQKNNLEIIKLLITKENINDQDEDKNTPLHLAYPDQGNKTKVIEILMKSGANPDIKNNKGVVPSSMTFKIKAKQLLEGINWAADDNCGKQF